jgi:ribonuclease III
MNNFNQGINSINLDSAKKKINSKLYDHIFYTNYKLILYDINCIFYSHENSEIFLGKIAEFHNKRCVQAGLPEKKLEDLISQLKSKYYPSIPSIEFQNLSTYDLLIEAKTGCESVNGFRKMSETNNMPINYKAEAFGYGYPIKPISNFDFTYNKNTSPSANQQKVSKLKNDISIYNIFPLEYLNTYFLDKKQYKFLSKLPTLLTEFERILLSHQFCCEFLFAEEHQMMNYEDLQIFLHALTSPGLLQDYSFESLETLGDSIIKFILTTCIHYNYPHYTEGRAQGLRRDLLKNDKLQDIAIGNFIYKYIVNFPLKISKWEPPLKRNLKIKFEQSLAKKCAADSLEAIVGACYMQSKNIATSLKFMRKVKIITDDLMIKKNIIEKFSLNEYELKWTVDFSNSNTEQGFQNQNDLSFIEIFFSNKTQSQFEVCLPFSKPLLDENEKINPKALRELEKRINYKFKDSSLLVCAFTHQSYTKDLFKNYQRLELLGDSILEVYLLIRLFLIFEEKLFDPEENYDKNFHSIFNCGNLTHAKSLLVSNYFLMRLIVLLNLQEFILMKDKTNIEKIEIFFDENNILHLLNQKINEYSSKATGSKILSDVFEALLGAIFIDSNLQKCFDFLDSIYEPFLYYTTTNLQNIKYSPVSEFIEICHKKFGVGPKFSKQELKDKMIQISAWANEKMICQGIGNTEESAKEKAVLEGMAILNEESSDSMKID